MCFSCVGNASLKFEVELLEVEKAPENVKQVWLHSHQTNSTNILRKLQHTKQEKGAVKKEEEGPAEITEAVDEGTEQVKVKEEL